MDCLTLAFGLICFDAPPPTSAQVLEILHRHRSIPRRSVHIDDTGYNEYRDYSYRTARRPRRYRSNNMSGPWEWPPEAPRRRLDGTLLSDPIQVYGPQIVYPFFYPWQPYPYYPRHQIPQPPSYRSPSEFPYDWRSENSDSVRRGSPTGSLWQQNRPDGPLSGFDKRGNPWTYDSKTRTYQNLGTGEVCQGQACIDR